MDMDRVRIADAITTEYSDFLSFCSASGKIFISELTNVDFVAFRTGSGQSRDYIKLIRAMLDNPVVAATTEVDAVQKGSENVKNELQGDPFDAGKYLALEDQSTPSKTESPSWTQPNEQPAKNVEAALDETSCSDRKNDTKNETADRTTEEIVVASTGTATTALSSTEHSDDSEYTLAYLFDVKPSSFEDIGIIALNLGVRPTRCLNSAKIKTIAEVLARTTDELKAIKSMGVKSVNEIVQKVKDYVSDPANLDVATISDVSNHTPKHERVELDPAFKSALEAMLMGDEYSTDGLSDNQMGYFEKLKEASETVGEDICLEAYLNPEYVLTICNALMEFATPYIQYRNAMNEAVQKIGNLPDSMRQLKAMPFIRAYSATAGEKLSYLLSECSDDTTVERIPLLYEKLRKEENMAVLTSDTNKFLEWLNFDVFTLISSISANIRSILAGRNERAIEIFALRSKGETLEAVGSLYGVTRERIRQIENKVHRTFWDVYEKQKYDLIMLVYALRNGDNVLHFDELKNTLGDEFATVLWACIKHNQEHEHYYYSKTLDAIVVKTDDAKNMSESALLSTIEALLTTLPDVMLASEKESTIAELAEKNSIPKETLNDVFDSIYQQTENFLHKGRLTVVFMCEYVLKNRFQAGFKIADDFEADRFRQYMVELFGTRAKTITTRAIDADVGRLGVLCDRGKYIHPDYLVVDPSVIDTISDYIEASPRSLIPYGELFDALREKLEGTQITNRFLLQGALKKYGCKFNTGRDFVRKTKSVTFVDELESFVSDRGIVHKSEILAEFTSLGEAGLGQVVSRSANVFNIENGYYIHAEQFDIQPEDYEMLRGYLSEACKEIPVNIRSVYDAVAEQFPEFMYRNDFEDRNKLFAALNYMFREEFSFSRPYIAKLGVSDISNRSVILQHIEDYDSIEIEELIDICDENGIHYVAPAYLCQMIAPDFIRVNRTTLMRRELTGITDEVIEQANSIIRDLLEVNGYIVGSKVNDFLWYPQIDIDWTEFLLENLIVQSKKINVIYMFGDPLQHPNAIYVAEEFGKDTFDSFLIKILTEEVHKGSFTSKVEMRDWLREEGMIEAKLPNFLESAKYFYVNETGVHCTGE